MAYIGQKNGVAEIWDPSGGKKFMDKEQLSATWEGHAIEVLPLDSPMK